MTTASEPIDVPRACNWKASPWLEDAVGPYAIIVNPGGLEARPLGLFTPGKDWKLYPQIGRGELSGKPESPDDMREKALQNERVVPIVAKVLIHSSRSAKPSCAKSTLGFR